MPIDRSIKEPAENFNIFKKMIFQRVPFRRYATQGLKPETLEKISTFVAKMAKPKTAFKDLYVAAPIRLAMEENLKWTHPTNTQKEMIPYALKNENMMMTSRPGTGTRIGWTIAC
jgi:hypothetical protein